MWESVNQETEAYLSALCYYNEMPEATNFIKKKFSLDHEFKCLSPTLDPPVRWDTMMGTHGKVE